MDGQGQQQHLGIHQSGRRPNNRDTDQTPSRDDKPAIDITHRTNNTSTTSRPRLKQQTLDTTLRPPAKSSHKSPPTSTVPVGARRSARISISASGPEATQSDSSTGGGKGKVHIAEHVTTGDIQTPHKSARSSPHPDRKGKKRARSPSPPPDLSPSPTGKTPTKRARKSTDTSEVRYSLRRRSQENFEATSLPSSPKGKGKAKSPVKGKKVAKEMLKKTNLRQRRTGMSSPSDRTKKGDSASKHLIDNPMDDDESQWMDEPGGSRSGFMMDDDEDEDHMIGSGLDDVDDDEDGHSDDDDEEGEGGVAGGLAAEIGNLSRRAREGGLNLDEATAAAIFGGGFRAFGGMMSGLSNRFKRLKNDLRSPNSATRLAALRECSELLLVSNEDTLGAAFSTNSFATEFIAILRGKPNIDEKAEDTHHESGQMNEDAQLAAALALSTGGEMSAGLENEDELECQLVACRCLAHLLEALPGSGHTLAHLGAVPVLCSKLTEISYIELAEQTLSTMEKISAECPSAIVKEGGLGALLNYLPFFSTNVQRTAVTAAANCCRNISSEHFSQIRDVFPILRETLTQADQRLVEQATLAVVRTVESYRHNAEHLEGLLDVPTVVAVNSLLMPSGGSPLLSPSTYTHLLRALTTSARGSAKVAIAFLEAGMTNTIYQILTGVLPSSHDQDEQGLGAAGQGLAGGVADMAVLQNLAHRPKDQVEEALALICELLPPPPRDGVFDYKAYTEKSLSRIKKGRKVERSEKPTRRSSRVADASTTPTGSTGPSTPAIGANIILPGSDATQTASHSASVKEAVAKAKREAEAQIEQRLDLFKTRPELLGKYIKAIVPVLVDVYAASVASRVRTKVLMGLIKATAFAEQDDLMATLKAVPMASFLCAIISSKDNHFFVLSALQLVELLATKIPDVYRVSFQREGVVFEIEALAEQELSTVKKAKAEAEVAAVKMEPEGPDTSVAGPSSSITRPPVPPSGIPEDLKPIFASAGIPAMPASFLMDLSSSTSTPRRPTPSMDPADANIVRARVLIAKKVFKVADGEEKNAASAVLDEVATLVKKLCTPETSESERRHVLRGLSKYFSSTDQALSSFEILKSGLVDGLLEFADMESTTTSSDRRAMFFEVFSDPKLSIPTPLATLVKRLHESLGRLEDFQVETAFDGLADATRPASSLSRTIRVRLLAEEGQDIPKQVSALSVTIQAIAPLQALHDYLRPRIAEGNFFTGSSLSNMFAAYASGMPGSRGGAGSGNAASRILSALNAAAGEMGPGATNTAQEGSSTAPTAGQVAGETSNQTEDQPRRRSARLSAQAPPDSEPTDAPTVQEQPSSNVPGDPILPSMPMDMDFDDEDFSDEEFDTEVFEEDMEEEMAPPAEKVVNMSVAPDGSRVEAKTPEGTRIATPNQAAGQSNAEASGTGTPRTASYAGAVKTTPADWHLEFSLNGAPLSLNDTIYGAVHKHKQNDNETSSMRSYGATVVFKFKKVDGPVPPTKAPLDAPSPASVASTMPTALESSTPTSKILRLLRVVHNLSVAGREAIVRSNSQMDENLFVNNKLTAKLTRQLEEVMIIASNCLPEWAIELPKHFSFLFPFETRYSFLQSNSFGYGRLIARSQSSQQSRNSRNRDDLSHLARIIRQKVRISRAQLLESCAKVLELYGTSNGILEVEYFDEIGTGLGPTLEFYSIASQEFARRALGIWRDDDEAKPGNYVHHPHGLYPAPMGPEEPLASTAGSRLSWFKTLGMFVGRALLDSRIIDVNLNKVFLQLILGQPTKKNIATLKLVDMPLARSLERLHSYLQIRKEIDALQLPPGARRNKLLALTVSGAKLADLSLDFTLPGHDIELIPGGAHLDVDDGNLEEYIEKVLDFTLGSGVMRQAKAFQEGFSMIIPVQDLKIFSPEELGLLFGNADEDWSRETLEHAIKADHGYNLDSRAVQSLVEVMSSYDKDDRRQFLQFITGAPKLPIGGFRGLNPPFTVVRKPHEAPFRADDYLPSVMTCAQYLKMPDYSTTDVLASQLKRAILDGGGSFHLS